MDTVVIKLPNSQILAIREEAIFGRHASDHTVFVRIGEELVYTGTKDSTVSRTHARIFWKNDILSVQDLGSTWGTWLNDQQIGTEVSGQPGTPVSVPPKASLRFGVSLEIELEQLSSTKLAPQVTQSEWVRMSSRMSYRDFSRYVIATEWAAKILERLNQPITLHEILAEGKKVLPHIQAETALHQRLKGLLSRFDAQLRMDESLDSSQADRLADFCRSLPTEMSGYLLNGGQR